MDVDDRVIASAEAADRQSWAALIYFDFPYNALVIGVLIQVRVVRA